MITWNNEVLKKTQTLCRTTGFQLCDFYVKQHINMCMDCVIHKRPSEHQPELLYPMPPGRHLFAILHIDHLGPFEKSRRGNQCLLVIVDNMTKYVTLYPSKTTNTAGVTKRLVVFIELRGLLDRIISDKGNTFTSNKFKEFCQSKGINHTFNSTRHP